VFVLVFAYFILKEKITKHKVITILVTITGLAIINPFQKGDFLLGSILTLVAALVYGLLIVLMRLEDKFETIGAVVWFLFFATLFSVPLPFIFGLGSPTFLEWSYVLGLGVISTGLAYLLINLALETLEAEIVSLLSTTLMPLVAIVLSVILFKETLNLRILIGGTILILAGVYIQVRSKLLDTESFSFLHGYK
jgi:drug/metabolite transporter (DMT)-like permease